MICVHKVKLRQREELMENEPEERGDKRREKGKKSCNIQSDCVIRNWSIVLLSFFLPGDTQVYWDPFLPA